MGVLSREMDDDELFLNAEYYTGQCKMEMSCVKKFESFVAKLESKFQKMAQNSNNWNTTVGNLYEQEFTLFLIETAKNVNQVRNYQALSRFYKTYYEGEWAAPIHKLSLRNYAIWDDRSEKFSAFTLDKIGYTAILNKLIDDIPMKKVHFNSKISQIDYRHDQTKLKLVNGILVDELYDVVIVTVPLGHLKAHASHMFYPSLPQKKMDAINKMGKIVII